MLFTIFSLPENYFTSTTDIIAGTFNDLKVLIVFLIAVSFAMYYLPTVFKFLKDLAK
jgi:hypothetical protein